MKPYSITVALLALTCLNGPLAGVAQADVLRVTGVADVLSEPIEGQSVAVLRFELPLLRQGAGLTVISAMIDWEQPGITAETRLQLRGYQESVPSSRALDLPSLEAIARNTLSKDPILESSWYPQDFRRLGKCVLRFDATAVVDELIAGGIGEVRLMVATGDTGLEEASRVALSPVLIIRYGFLGDAKRSLTVQDVE